MLDAYAVNAPVVELKGGPDLRGMKKGVGVALATRFLGAFSTEIRDPTARHGKDLHHEHEVRDNAIVDAKDGNTATAA